MARQQQNTTEEVFTQVIPVIFCSNMTQVNRIMHLCGIPRSLTYNKLGSLQGWGASWMSADPIVRTILHPQDIQLPAKLWEWAVNDTMKAIIAQQAAAKAFIVKAIYQRTKDETEQKRLFDLMHNNPTSDPWLHRVIRKQYQRGHTFVRNQIVYQGAGYSVKRLSRSTLQIDVQGIEKGKRIILKARCRHVIAGQIRLIRNELGNLEIHTIRRRVIPKIAKSITTQIGIDKGYTEAFFTSNGDEIAAGLGKLMTAKTARITRANRNRYRLRSHAQNNPEKAATILKYNLGAQVKSKRLRAEKATIQNFIRRDLARVITSPTRIFAEDLTQPIKNKYESKALNRKLASWMKGELQASLESISKKTGSVLSTVNPAYTSQLDSLTGTLLGSRKGDRFTSFTGVVEQSDINAAQNILHRGSDTEITRWMKYAEVRRTLIRRTVRYLASIGTTVQMALDLGWLHSKFKTEALSCEAECSPSGVEGTVKPCDGRVPQTRKRAKKPRPRQEKPAILDTFIQLSLFAEI